MKRFFFGNRSASLQKLFWIAVAGGLGTLARYAFGGWVQRNVPLGFPWGTVCVNLTGCLAFGLMWSALENRMAVSSNLRTVILVGFMGGYTTFSSFIFETGQLIRDAEWLYAFGNIALQNVLGLAMLFAGLALGRLI
jgi:CrcB protein